jgi:hypothetical protein
MIVTIRGFRISLSKSVLGAIVLLLLVCVFGIFKMASGGNAPPVALPVPAFGTNLLATLKPNWIAPWQKAYGTIKANDSTQYIGEPAGTPVSLDVYIPAAASQSQYLGLVFMIAQTVDPTRNTDLTALQADAAPPVARQVVLGFMKGQLPSPGQIYRVTGLLYWRSDLLFPPAADGTVSPALPVFIIDGLPEAQQPAELRAAATQAEPIGLSYTENGEQITLVKAEWASGHEVRMLVRIRNLTTHTQPVWNGVSGATAQLPQQAPVSSIADPASPLATVTSLPPLQSVFGYIIFGADTGAQQSVADPNQVLTLSLPMLGGVDGDLQLLRLKPTITVS